MSLRVVPASVEDYPLFARLFPELGVIEETPSLAYFRENIVPGAIVAVEGAARVGYAWARPRGDRLHVVHVIADPAHRRRGVARALMDAIASRGRELGFRRWMLNVKPENVAARALYERCGMRVAFSSVSMRMTWSAVDRMPLTPAFRAGPLAPADDARFEDALGMTRGEIAAFRPLGRLIFGTEDADAPLGFVAFDPPFPGASPFRVRAPEHARALLEVARPHAVADHLFVFVEADPALEALFETAGGEPAMRVLRMEGELAPSAPAAGERQN